MATPRSVLISRIAPELRGSLYSDLVDALDPDDQPAIDFIGSLVVEEKQEDAARLFVAFLQRAIEAGKPDPAISFAAKHSEIRDALFAQSINTLAQVRSEWEATCLPRNSVASLLRFCKVTYPTLPPSSDMRQQALSGALELLQYSDETVCPAARDFIFTALSYNAPSTADPALRALKPDLWAHITQLLDADDLTKESRMLGYSLWLRWLLSTGQDCISLPAHGSLTYMEYIRRGLRQGDGEIRKISLSILKLSLDLRSSSAGSAERQRFERYVTVFETIVLGRYMNQIQECEDDLGELVAPDSPVSLDWMYCLLASALDGRMQESNRKFIGNWVMRSCFSPAGVRLLEFLQNDFLPWATQGSLFVVSLKHDAQGNATCVHGMNLAEYLVRCMKKAQAIGAGHRDLRTLLLDYVANKKTFPYAKVWLLKALSDVRFLHSDASGSAPYEEASAENVVRGLPDVARDYVSQKLAELRMLTGAESVASRRDMLEQEAIAKCSNVATAGALDDLWADLDYLEFPKALLMYVPAAILDSQLLVQALEDDDLATSLREKLSILQKVGITKTYLVSPLNTAVRATILETPTAYDLLDVNKFVMSAVNSPPQPTIDLVLEEATVHLFADYNDYFGERPSVGIAALLDAISRLRDQAQLETLVECLLQRWKAQKQPPPTVSTWKTTLQLQVLLLCLENLQPDASQANALAMHLLKILSIEPLPRYRYLFEWMVVRLLQRMRMEDLVVEQLASKDHHANPKFLASLMKIGSIIACSRSSKEEWAVKLAILYVPLAASSKIVIRHEAQWQVPTLFEHGRAKGWSAVTDNPALTALDDYIRSLERFHEPPPERNIGRFDPETHHTLTNLVEGAWFGLDSIEGPLTSRSDFLKLDLHPLPAKIEERCMPLGDPIAHRPVSAPVTETQRTAATKPAPRTIDDVTALQTKGTAYLARTLSDPTVAADRPDNLIVVGSLVDNPYNLGGLSRVSEIFGASALTLQNQNVIANKDFTSVSVSSHLHLPIVQLSAAGVPGYLAERKKEGFTVVGIEQTDRSSMLGSEGCKLPDKCVLVVGSEKEGIPAVVLTECNMLVEIPQKGVTRSLNVQTAVSVVLYDLERERREARE